MRSIVVRGKTKLWSACIGLEIHAQYISRTKLFSPSPTPSFRSNLIPNSSVSLFDAAYPGTYPQLSQESIEQAVKAAIAFNCKINQDSFFDRKHYFYYDLPLGYQITQSSRPIAQDGLLKVIVEKDIDGSPSNIDLKIDRIQLEQDSGKTIYRKMNGGEVAAVDLNRAGVGLLEIVMAPQLNTSLQAAAALARVQFLLRHLGICDGRIDRGNLRCDVNVSVVPYDEGNINLSGERVEIKNLSGPGNVMNSVEYEVKRQIALLESGGTVTRETRGFDDVKRQTYVQRSKEDKIDYRIFPDPDLPRVFVRSEDISRIKNGMKELPEVTVERLKHAYHLDSAQCLSIMSKLQYLKYFADVCDLLNQTVPSSAVFNFIYTDLRGILGKYFGSEDVLLMIMHSIMEGSTESVDDIETLEFPIAAKQIADILRMVHVEKAISGLQSKNMLAMFIELHCLHFEKMILSEVHSIHAISMRDFAKSHNLLQNSNDDAIIALCKESISDGKNAVQLERYKNGKTGTWKYFFGDIMKRSKGTADPLVVEKYIQSLLNDAIQKSE